MTALSAAAIKKYLDTLSNPSNSGAASDARGHASDTLAAEFERLQGAVTMARYTDPGMVDSARSELIAFAEATGNARWIRRAKR